MDGGPDDGRPARRSRLNGWAPWVAVALTFLVVVVGGLMGYAGVRRDVETMRTSRASEAEHRLVRDERITECKAQVAAMTEAVRANAEAAVEDRRHFSDKIDSLAKEVRVDLGNLGREVARLAESVRNANRTSRGRDRTAPD